MKRTQWNDRAGDIGMRVTRDSPDWTLLDADAARAVLARARQLLTNASRRLQRVGVAAYPTLRGSFHQYTRANRDEFAAGVRVVGEFFPFFEFDTRPHWAPWGGPTKKDPFREPSRLWEWVQRDNFGPDPPKSAYMVARALHKGRTENEMTKQKSRSGKKVATFGAYEMTDAFRAENARLTAEISALIRAAVAGQEVRS